MDITILRLVRDMNAVAVNMIMCFILGDFLLRFVKDMAPGAASIDEMFFTYITTTMADAGFFFMCTNLGDSLSFINQLFTLNMRKVVADSRIHVEYGCWHELPVELMEMILQNSDVTDRVRMSMVCTSWESTLKRKDIRVPPQFPWLLLPHEPKNCNNLTFYDLSRGRIHDFKLPKWIHGGQCFGSSKGWLVMGKGLPIKAQIFLFNPISGACHKLPSLGTLPCFRGNPLYHFFDPCRVRDFIKRIELSSEDPSNCIVATIMCNAPDMLAFCKVGSESWSIYEDEHLADILFSNKGVLYVLKFTDQESAATYSFTSKDVQITLNIIPLSHSNPIFNLEEYDDAYVEYLDGHFSITRDFFTVHLVESNNGQLLIVQKVVDTFNIIDANEEDADADEEDADADEEDAIEDDNEDHIINEEIEDDNEVDEQVEEDNNNILKYYRTKRFKIYMLDPEIGTSCMTNLTSLGNQILFFSMSGLSFVQARDFTGFQENCIYFIEDDLNKTQRYEHTPFVTRESGIFYLDDERIVRSFPSLKLPLLSYMGWFTPKPLDQQFSS